MVKQLDTIRGKISYPAFIPVTTFGGKFPLDEIVRPYLDRFAPAMMVSHFYAQKINNKTNIPVFIDSGGFASLFDGTEIIDQGEVAIIKTKDKSYIHPAEVLQFQQKYADIGATVDFIITPQLGEAEAKRRQKLSVKNAIWAIKKKQNNALKLFASIQAWDANSVKEITMQLAEHPFDGFALGGMVSRIAKPEKIFEIVDAIRRIDKDRPLHVFGIGKPELVKQLFNLGVDSVDSSSFVQYAVDKKYLDPKTGTYQRIGDLLDLSTYCQCVICKNVTKEYILLKGELNNLSLVLHNLSAIGAFVRQSKS
jgi:tRNA-guanine family transglycosylase